jgi:hypothetical protein
VTGVSDSRRSLFAQRHKPTLDEESGMGGQCFASCLLHLVNDRRAEISLQSLCGGSEVAHATLVVYGKSRKAGGQKAIHTALARFG